jgi:hypothetical protein
MQGEEDYQIEKSTWFGQGSQRIRGALFVTYSGWNRLNRLNMGTVAAILMVCVVCSCTNGMFGLTTKISDILATPSKFADKEVTIQGKVTDSLILLGRGYFVVSDPTGSMTVIPAKTFPRVGEIVKISGVVKNAFVVGDKSLTVIIENSQ